MYVFFPLSRHEYSQNNGQHNQARAVRKKLPFLGWWKPSSVLDVMCYEDTICPSSGSPLCVTELLLEMVQYERSQKRGLRTRIRFRLLKDMSRIVFLTF